MKILIAVFLVVIIGCIDDSVAQSDSKISKKFEMMHDMNWPNEPDNFSLKKLPTFQKATNSGVYWDSLSDKYTDDPSESDTKQYVMTFPYGVRHYVNIEHLPYRFDKSTETEQLNTIRKLSNILYWTKQQRPDIEIGIFYIITERFWNTLDNYPQELIDRNKRFSALSTYVDVNYLMMYTWIVDRPDRWKQALISSVNQAREIDKDKKLVVFLMPHYHSPGNRNTLIPGREWRMYLEESYKLSDGVVIWDKWGCDWQDINCADATDPNNWWYQTLDFMRQKGL